VSENVDSLLVNAIVLTMDDNMKRYEPGALAVQDDRITAVGPEGELKSLYTSSQTIDCGGKVLMPGLVNAHTHVPMTLLRGLADDLRLDVWLMGYMMPVEREFVSPEFVRLGTQLGCIELIRGGVTCFADMYYFEEEVARATAEIGLRAVCSQTILKFPAPDADYFEESLAYAREYIQRWKDHPLIIPSVAPHALYTSTEELLRSSAALAVEFDVPLHTHIAETKQEEEDAREQFDMPVVPYVKKQNLFDAKVLAAHCVHLDDGEQHTLFHHGAGVAHNPSSNLKLASGFAPITNMMEIGLNVGIGTDGPASNNDLDMFEEMRLASFVAKASTGDPTALPAPTILTMATRLGAHALHIGDMTGSLEPGKRADLILLDVSNLHTRPHFRRDPDGLYSDIVYSAKSTDVTDVMVNGRWLMRDHELPGIDDQALLDQAQDYARQIDRFLIKREQSVLSKLVAIGGTTQVESFEVQAKVPIADRSAVQEIINDPASELEILHTRHYREFDTYFSFEDQEQGYLRYREDEFIDKQGEVSNIRYRLTLIGPTREEHFPSDVLLSRSRYIAPATHSLRFYHEYFKPSQETYIEKDRLRWRVLYKGTEYYINLDKLIQPDLGHFLEVKSRTWSLRDAEHKAEIASDLIEYLSASPNRTQTKDYVEMIEVSA
jgi:5-methylthioadenosine/S-adenosylhomocysteine deaminase